VMEGRGQPTRAASAITHTRRQDELRVLSRPLSSLARTYSINLVERSEVILVKVLLPRGYVSCTVVELGHCVLRSFNGAVLRKKGNKKT